jgi:hypothetical protein
MLKKFVIIVAFALILLPTISHAQRYSCKTNPAIGHCSGPYPHDGFCGGMSKWQCDTHSSLCTWYVDNNCDFNDRPRDPNYGHCSGPYPHDSFCAGMERRQCEFHSLCTWYVD